MRGRYIRYDGEYGSVSQLTKTKASHKTAHIRTYFMSLLIDIGQRTRVIRHFAELPKNLNSKHFSLPKAMLNAHQSVSV
jgi:hypothetical protein